MLTFTSWRGSQCLWLSCSIPLSQTTVNPCWTPVLLFPKAKRRNTSAACREHLGYFVMSAMKSSHGCLNTVIFCQDYEWENRTTHKKSEWTLNRSQHGELEFITCGQKWFLCEKRVNGQLQSYKRCVFDRVVLFHLWVQDVLALLPPTLLNRVTFPKLKGLKSWPFLICTVRSKCPYCIHVQLSVIRNNICIYLYLCLAVTHTSQCRVR